MNQGRTVFSQLVEFLPTYQFQICVERYQGNRYVKDFFCWDQFLCLAFAQLSYRESFRDIEACLRAQRFLDSFHTDTQKRGFRAISQPGTRLDITLLIDIRVCSLKSLPRALCERLFGRSQASTPDFYIVFLTHEAI